jgi:homoprotocatechuate degradation regulator HpaR
VLNVIGLVLLQSVSLPQEGHAANAVFIQQDRPEVLVAPAPAGSGMSGLRKLPPFERTLGAVLHGTREAVLAPMRPKLREHEITEPQWRVMRVLNDRGATDATSLAGVTMLHAPSVTRILKDLEERRLVEREPDANDARRTLVELTSAGRDMVKIISRDVLRVVRAYSDRFGAQRLERLNDELRALAAAIKGVE